MSNDDWNEKRLRLLRKGRADGLSNSKIAEIINAKTGSSFTRNACIGKALRIGLVTHSPRALVLQRKQPRRAQRRDTNFRRPVEPAPVDFRSLKEVESAAPPTEFLGIRFADLKQHHCRYPRGGNNGEPILYCGQPKIEHSAYCAACHTRCHSGHIYIRRAA